VGLAIGGKKLAWMINGNGQKLVNYSVICLCGDGCLQEGIAAEACSLAGHLHLDNLVLIYDRNDFTLDGNVSRSQSEDVEKRFAAYGFDVEIVDGRDVTQIIAAYSGLVASKNCRPKLLIANTIIGDGIAEIAGTSRAHGEAGVKFAKAAKSTLGLPDCDFFVSDAVGKFFANLTDERVLEYSTWSLAFANRLKDNPELGESLFGGVDFCEKLAEFEGPRPAEKVSTRAANGEIMQFLAKHDGMMLTGSADLFTSNKNHLDEYSDFSATDNGGRNIEFGVREHAMGAITNGICYDGIFRPSCSTFLVFSDYMRAAIRVAALSKIHALYLFTHDSIAVGQDGPTHQPVEALASLRCIPNLCVFRPADYEELIGAWMAYYSRKECPFAFILSRQNLPVLRDSGTSRMEVSRGAYVVRWEKSRLRCIVIATGSELSIAIEAARKFDDVRVVSMPCMELFEEQDGAFREKILPQACQCRVAVEAGIAMPWYKYIGNGGKCICVNKFGFSGLPDDLYIANGLTVSNLGAELDNSEKEDIL
jgi:transketolase